MPNPTPVDYWPNGPTGTRGTVYDLCSAWQSAGLDSCRDCCPHRAPTDSVTVSTQRAVPIRWARHEEGENSEIRQRFIWLTANAIRVRCALPTVEYSPEAGQSVGIANILTRCNWSSAEAQKLRREVLEAARRWAQQPNVAPFNLLSRASIWEITVLPSMLQATPAMQEAPPEQEAPPGLESYILGVRLAYGEAAAAAIPLLREFTQDQILYLQQNAERLAREWEPQTGFLFGPRITLQQIEAARALAAAGFPLSASSARLPPYTQRTPTPPNTHSLDSAWRADAANLTSDAVAALPPPQRRPSTADRLEAVRTLYGMRVVTDLLALQRRSQYQVRTLGANAEAYRIELRANPALHFDGIPIEAAEIDAAEHLFSTLYRNEIRRTSELLPPFIGRPRRNPRNPAAPLDPNTMRLPRQFATVNQPLTAPTARRATAKLQGLKAIKAIGIEVEGAWSRERLPRDYKSDASVRVREPGMYQGELASQPFGSIPNLCRAALDVSTLQEFVTRNYPDLTGPSCGLHVHVSLADAAQTQAVANRILKQHSAWEAVLIQRLRSWAKRAKVRNTTLAARLSGKNKYCLRGWDGNTALEPRRRVINLQAIQRHNTIEIRVLPMFRSSALALSAIIEVVRIMDGICARAARKATQPKLTKARGEARIKAVERDDYKKTVDFAV